MSVLWFNNADEPDVFMDTIQGCLDERPDIKVGLQIIPFIIEQNF